MTTTMTEGRPWDPTVEPYRVRWVYRTDAAGLHGWAAREETYPTEAEARAAFDAPLSPRDIDVRLSVAVNPETWTKNGKWQHLATRRAKRGA